MGDGGKVHASKHRVWIPGTNIEKLGRVVHACNMYLVTGTLDRVQIGRSLKLIDASQPSRSDELQAQRDTLSQKERVMCD